jgi:hypothetical protein
LRSTVRLGRAHSILADLGVAFARIEHRAEDRRPERIATDWPTF